MNASECIGRFPFLGVLQPHPNGKPDCAVLRGSSANSSVFAHAKAVAFGLASPFKSWHGKACLFAYGNDPTREGARAISWIPVDAVAFEDAKPIAEKDWNVRRSTALERFDVKDIRRLIEAKWYAKAPTSSSGSVARTQGGALFDPILPGIVAAHVRRLSVESPHFGNLNAALENSPFRHGFSGALPAVLQAISTSDYEPLQSCSVSELLAVLGPLQLSKLFSPNPQQIARTKPNDRRAVIEWLLRRGEQCAQLTSLRGWEQDLAAVATEIVDDKTFQPSPETIAFLFSPVALNHSPFDRVVERAGHEPTWAAKVPDKEKWRIELAAGRIAAALALCKRAGNPEAWSLLIERTALAVDLETDGESVWQIGIAQHGQKECLYDLNGVLGPASLDSALSVLADRLSRASVVVGHHLLAWDAPILEGARPGLLGGAVIWDTLLVRCMLEPARATFSLGGKHAAADDAYDALTLFLEQGRSIGWPTLDNVLAGASRSSQGLLNQIAERAAELARLPDSESTVGSLIQHAISSPNEVVRVAAPPALGAHGK